MSEKIFFVTRDHEAGPGEWCLRSTRVSGWKEHIGSRTYAILISMILNNKDKYPELESLLAGIAYSEHVNFIHKDDIPPRKVQEELINTINSITETK
jgi:hypothetical protein